MVGISKYSSEEICFVVERKKMGMSNAQIANMYCAHWGGIKDVRDFSIGSVKYIVSKYQDDPK